MNQFFEQMKQIWGRMTRSQRLMIGGVGALTVLGGVLAVSAGGSTEWRPLAGDLPRKEMQATLAKLDDQSIPYRLRDGGNSVDVPADRWEDVQAVVVKESLLDGKSGRGYEQIMGGGLMDTRAQREFKQLVAKQEELEMAIGRLEGIDEAAVYITPAKSHWTRERSERAKASVMLRAAPGHLVTGSQVETVVRFVANAVGELDAESVVVTDTRGTVLARPQGARAIGAATNLAQTHGVRLQGHAQEALERVFGVDKVVVRCHVDLDNEMVRTETEGIVPDSKVVVSESIRSTEDKKPRGSGVASTAPLNTSKRGRAGATLTTSKTEDLKTEYEIGREKTVRVKEGGAVKHLAVSVIADESLQEHEAAIESIVKSAVGYQVRRGDTWGGVSFAPFVEPVTVSAPAAPGLWTTGFIWEVATWAITGVVGVVLALMVWRSTRRAQRDVQAALANIAEEKSDKDFEVRPDPAAELRDVVDEDAETVSKLLRNWLYEPAGSR